MAKTPLPVSPYLVNRDVDPEDPALRGTLRCTCGGETFHLYHSGKQAHPLLGSWFSNWINADRETLVIDARCSACGRVIPLHCDDRSDEGWRVPENSKMTAFVHPRLHDQRLRVEVAYRWAEAITADGWHEAYTDFILDAWNDAHPKKIRIFE